MVILVGLDDSDSAADALRWAARTAAARGDTVAVARAWFYGRLSAFGGATTSGPEEMDRDVAEEARERVAEVLGADAEVPVTVLRGLPRHALAEEVRRSRPDIVVVGHRPLSSADAMLLGSVGRRLLETSPVPVVLVRAGALTDAAATGPVVVGVDGSDDALRAAGFAADIAAATGAELVLAHVEFASSQVALGAAPPPPPDEHEVLVAAVEHVADRGVACRTVLEWGDPRSALEDVALSEGAGLLVVATRGRGAVAELVLGSVASYAAQHVAVPVAVVPPTGR